MEFAWIYYMYEELRFTILYIQSKCVINKYWIRSRSSSCWRLFYEMQNVQTKIDWAEAQLSFMNVFAPATLSIKNSTKIQMSLAWLNQIPVQDDQYEPDDCVLELVFIA